VAADLRTAFRVTAGPEKPAAKAFSWVLPPSRKGRLDDFRAGVVLDDPQSSVTAETGAVLFDAVDALAGAGVKVVEGWPEGIDPGQISESFGFRVALFVAFREPGEQEFAPLSVVIEQEQRRMAARAAWSAYFHDVDVSCAQ
jgi:amidase